MTSIDVATADSLALITLSAHQRRNALTFEMVEELVAALDELAGRSDVSALVVTGAGRAFCAGAELSTLESSDRADLCRIYDGFLRVASFPLPTVAAVNGAAVGAGLNLALACDVRVAASSARFVARFLELGLHPGGGHTWMLQRAIGPQAAAAMVLLGESLDGESAARLGLALKCVPDDRLLDAASELGRRAAAAPRPLLARVKETMRATTGLETLDEAVELELIAQEWSMNQDFFHERLRAVRARIESRSDAS